MGIDISAFRDMFFVEAAEHLDAMEAALLQLEAVPADQELLNTIFRAAHTIKGGSGTFGMLTISRFTHVLENLLDRLREGTISLNDNLVALLFDSIDVIQALIQAEKSDGPPPENMDAVLAALQSIHAVDASAIGTSESSAGMTDSPTANSAKAAEDAARQVTIEFTPSSNFFMSGQDPLLLLRQLEELGTLQSKLEQVENLPDVHDLDPEESHVAWRLQLQTAASVSEIEDVFAFIDDQCQLKIVASESAQAGDAAARALSTKSPQLDSVATNITAPVSAVGESKSGPGNSGTVEPSTNRVASESPATLPGNIKDKGSKPATASGRSSGNGDSETVRVDRRRLDELINQIGELVIGVSMVEREVEAIHQGTESAAMLQLAKIVRDLQELSLSLRMVPIAATFQKMARVVHDIGRKLGKQIEFITEGDDTELDKSVVDKIGDPLIHMVRNAADHGIEMPADRIAAGKPSAGKVTLRAFQQGGNIFIELTDDGRGLNRKAIQAKAIERGLISAGDTLSDADICNLIFQPGFSTAKEITDVSGRGVGMDVVRRNVEDLQGSVQVRSTEGHGSTITVRLPLTLAILDGLLVQVRSEVYVVPLLSVVESISITSGEVRQLVGAGNVILLRGEVIPVISLTQLLQSNYASQDSDKRLLVIVEDQGRRFALIVDELVGQQQVVIKNLESNFRKVQGVAGATILGDGCVALILDVNGIACMHLERNQPGSKLESLSSPATIG